ncbi:bacillithiol biosynthesis cysteine-adding enzyme BshC [Marivirga sp. S37H4]|uniref:Putative cysteine ligase BshC n=1 Tax=Marivirga aurantiaca TaxID=2802615 RepID=A0A935CAZ2_9BACT|nr:bacillithiol biosynthesis cysteine-adding enzyme BshC [Marivirga aurantiaca]MBK6266875.1 bacillithiol biosynthesis cysteine-adding enzyme BshC [Marivirga aurantiaca]
MKVECIEFSETGQFAPIFNDFVEQKEVLKTFYHRFPLIENFKDQIKEKAGHPVNREVLVQSLKNQYQSIPNLSEKFVSKIESLQSVKTFTVTTGHQLNIFSGPLYFHFKIITVINACRSLKKAYPDYNFVPVYWMASEDHDLEEIKTVQVEGKKYKWPTTQTGAVGKMKTEGLGKLADQIEKVNGLFHQAYNKAGNLAEAVRYYVHELYGKEGLVVLDGDDSGLKKYLIPAIKEDVVNNTANSLVEKQSAKLEESGYKSQTFPREINFFYLQDGIRCRIVKAESGYKVLDTDIQFSEKEILDEIDSNPQNFSPNVILRPLYQEIILPNLAYTGGPAEVAYWMQLKLVFKHFDVPFPILLPRNFGMIIPNKIQHKIKKLKLSNVQLFKEKEKLKKTIIKKISAQKLNLNEERQQLLQLMEEIQQYAEDIDLSLAEMASAETQKIRNAIDKIEKKMLAAEKRKHSDKMRQIDEITDYLFPGSGLQERKENFLPFYKSDPAFIDKLLKSFDPFNLKFHILRWDG